MSHFKEYDLDADSDDNKSLSSIETIQLNDEENPLVKIDLGNLSTRNNTKNKRSISSFYTIKQKFKRTYYQKMTLDERKIYNKKVNQNRKQKFCSIKCEQKEINAHLEKSVKCEEKEINAHLEKSVKCEEKEINAYLEKSVKCEEKEINAHLEKSVNCEEKYDGLLYKHHRSKYYYYKRFQGMTPAEIKLYNKQRYANRIQKRNQKISLMNEEEKEAYFKRKKELVRTYYLNYLSNEKPKPKRKPKPKGKYPGIKREDLPIDKLIEIRAKARARNKIYWANISQEKRNRKNNNSRLLYHKNKIQKQNYINENKDSSLSTDKLIVYSNLGTNPQKLKRKRKIIVPNDEIQYELFTKKLKEDEDKYKLYNASNIKENKSVIDQINYL